MAKYAKRNVSTIDYSGPFFTKDPGKTFEENIDAMMKAMAMEAWKDVRAQIYQRQPQMPYWTGFSTKRIARRMIHPWKTGRAYSLVWASTDGLPGRPEARAASGNRSQFRGNAAAIVHAAQATIEARWHPYRKTTNRLRRSRAVNRAELTKGM